MDTIPPLSLPILLDGATGSELYKRGMPAGACTEQWVLGHPEALLELQRGYVAAGSQVLIAWMNKNKKFQKDKLTQEGCTEFKEFFNRD